MTTPQPTAPNPFALMMEPEVVFAAMASSDRLARLKSRICRPLDKLPTPPDEDAATASHPSVTVLAERAEASN